ncbi:hypothetical protein BgiBS90_029069 [Biomphalaria glabrata]|nr:hypothetical protein BgiBS90_029069 [Biomphalaria glabrata]
MKLNNSTESKKYVSITLSNNNALLFYKCMGYSATCTLFASHSENETYNVNTVVLGSPYKSSCPQYECRFKHLISLEKYQNYSYTHKVLCELNSTKNGCTCENATFIINWQTKDEHFKSDDVAVLSANTTDCSSYKTSVNLINAMNTSDGEDDPPKSKSYDTTVVAMSVTAVLISTILLVICVIKNRTFFRSIKNDLINRVLQNNAGNRQADIEKERGLTSPSPNQCSGAEVNNVYSCLREEVKTLQHEYECLPLSNVERSKSVVVDPLPNSMSTLVDTNVRVNAIEINSLTSGATGVYSLAKVV